MSKVMLVEMRSISPQEVKDLTDRYFRVYMLPLRGNKVYELSSDGESITVVLVQDTPSEELKIVLGTTVETITAGTTLLLQMNNDRQSKKAHQTMAGIYATRGIYWYSRVKAQWEISAYNARNQAITK